MLKECLFKTCVFASVCVCKHKRYRMKIRYSSHLNLTTHSKHWVFKTIVTNSHTIAQLSK